MSEPTAEPRAVTPVFGWHVPVLGDVPNVPADINALAVGIEASLKAPAGMSYLRADRTTNTAALAAATVVSIPMESVNFSAGSDLSLVSGFIQVATAGRYDFGASIRALNIPASSSLDLLVQVWRAGAVWAGWNIGGLTSGSQVMPVHQPAAAHFAPNLAVGDQFRMVAYCANAGASIGLGSFLWARRVG